MSIWGVLKSDIRPPKSLFFDFSSFSKLPKAARLMSVFHASKNQKIELLSVQSSVLGTPICKKKSKQGSMEICFQKGEKPKIQVYKTKAVATSS